MSGNIAALIVAAVLLLFVLVALQTPTYGLR